MLDFPPFCRSCNKAEIIGGRVFCHMSGEYIPSWCEGCKAEDDRYYDSED